MADQDPFKILINDKTFIYSKEFLISHSDYFGKMISSNYKEGIANLVEMKEFDAFAFHLVVEYIKNGSMKITETMENTRKALECASYLMFDDVKKFCVGQLLPQINIGNCFDIYKWAEKYSCSELADPALTCATWNCKIIFNSNSFLEEESKDLGNFLRRPELNVHGKKEIIVWEECIYKWIMEDEEKRKPYLLFLLTCIDYTNLELDDITKIINNDLIIEDALVTDFLIWIKNSLKDKNLKNINYKDYINSNYCDETIDDLKSILSKTDAVKRFHSSTPWLVAFEVSDDIGGARSSKPIILCFNYESNGITEQVPLSKLPEDATFCVGFRVCSVGYSFYVLGGHYQHIGFEKWNEQVWSYDTLTRKWQEHGRLPELRRHHMMCVVDSVIYLFGGYGNNKASLNSMNAYDTINRKWLENLPNTPFTGSIPNHSCCVYKQSILVFVKDKLYTYNLESNVWLSEQIDSTEVRSYVAAVCHNDLIYLLRYCSNEIYVLNLCEKIKYFGSFQNNTENVCIADDAIFSFSVDDNLKNKAIEDTINIIEVIPLSEESKKKYEALSKAHQNSTQQNLSKENDLSAVNKDPGTSTKLNEDEPEYKQIERSKLNVEANHSQHSRHVLKQDLAKENIHEQNSQTVSSVSEEDSKDISIQQQQMNMPQGSQMVTPCEQLYRSPKRGIKIWDSKMAKPVLYNIPFITGSSSHGCSTLFKLAGSTIKKEKKLEQNTH